MIPRFVRSSFTVSCPPNDRQEIDLEFLKARDSNGFRGYPINIVLHSSESNAQGNDASRTGGYETVVLPFDPTNAVHEYRFGKLTLALFFFDV